MTDLSGVRDASSLPAGLAARLCEELSMPFLPTVFTLLGEHRRYLRCAVEAFLAEPPGRVQKHACACRQIGSEAAAGLVEVPLALGSATSSIQALIDLYNQVNPPSLLFTLYLSAGGVSPPPVMAAPLPPAPPAATGRDGLLADIRACHGDFNVPGFWRELVTGWPEHGGPAWALVRRLADDPRFVGAVQAVCASTREALAERAAPRPRELGCSPGQAQDIWGIVSFYSVVIPTMLVEIECLRRAVASGSPLARASCGPEVAA